ncbi:hypothetical protein DS745_11885 [Anaerobacillus alkaliphilus]|uniref:Uncharacterized protein n=1 Tax=Anaerobacillus alkaliphilus TaxID=1548597 RepID=A0A4Q0VSE5_9BACI|nr:hypothetical protein [Anaerobacillus alkaliphilus]RXJ00227.1 hypothetical protein DS745_11885 [Anaerobacillus alkaliphilus]
MVFTATPPRIVLVILLLLQIFSFNLSTNLPLRVFQIALMLFIFCALLIKYQFEIHNERLIYQILIFSKPIFKRELVPNDIIEITFKHVGWGTKAAFVKVKKGVNWRIIGFVPDHVYSELANYATENDVKVALDFFKN